jgi:Icc-related predicted phosphoesterase
MKICAVSDLHGHLPEIPPCDLLLIAGDISPIRLADPEEQRAWCSSYFAAWLSNRERCQAERVVWVAGNHDTWIWKWGIGRKLYHLPRVTYLQDSEATIEGLKVYGSPWTRGLGSATSWWAFDLLGIPGDADPFAAIPGDADVVLTHSPPLGVGDLILRGGRVGSEELFQRLQQVKPRLAVNGHIHEDYGVRRLASGSETVVANAALLDVNYRPQVEREPLIFEL